MIVAGREPTVNPGEPATRWKRRKVETAAARAAADLRKDRGGARCIVLVLSEGARWCTVHRARSFGKIEVVQGASGSIFRKDRGCTRCIEVVLSERSRMYAVHQGRSFGKTGDVHGASRSFFRKDRGCAQCTKVVLSERSRMCTVHQGRSLRHFDRDAGGAGHPPRSFCSSCAAAGSYFPKERPCCRVFNRALSERSTLMHLARGRSFGKNDLVAPCTRSFFPKERP